MIRYFRERSSFWWAIRLRDSYYINNPLLIDLTIFTYALAWMLGKFEKSDIRKIKMSLKSFGGIYDETLKVTGVTFCTYLKHFCKLHHPKYSYTYKKVKLVVGCPPTTWVYFNSNLTLNCFHKKSKVNTWKSNFWNTNRATKTVVYPVTDKLFPRNSLIIYMKILIIFFA